MYILTLGKLFPKAIIPTCYKGLSRNILPSSIYKFDPEDLVSEYFIEEIGQTKSLKTIANFLSRLNKYTNEVLDVIIGKNPHEAVPEQIKYVPLGYEVVVFEDESLISSILAFNVQNDNRLKIILEKHISKLNDKYLFDNYMDAKAFRDELEIIKQEYSDLFVEYPDEPIEVKEILLVTNIEEFLKKELILH